MVRVHDNHNILSEPYSFCGMAWSDLILSYIVQESVNSCPWEHQANLEIISNFREKGIKVYAGMEAYVCKYIHTTAYYKNPRRDRQLFFYI